MDDSIVLERRSIVKRLFFLRQAEDRATDPSFKAMWYFKRTQPEQRRRQKTETIFRMYLLFGLIFTTRPNPK